jgi:hypothetical protein
MCDCGDPRPLPTHQPFYRFSPFSEKSEKPCFEPSWAGTYLLQGRKGFILICTASMYSHSFSFFVLVVVVKIILNLLRIELKSKISKLVVFDILHVMS